MSKKSISIIFAIALLASIAMPAYSVNLLKNPSLETWTSVRQPQNWTVEDTNYCKVYKESTNKYHGSYAAKMKRFQTGTGNNKGIIQQCTIPGTGRYIARARFWENSDSTSGGLTITWRTATGTFISSWTTTYTTNTPTWQVVQRNLATDTAPANAGLADFIVRTYGLSTSASGGTVYVDSLFFERVTGIEEENGSTLRNIRSLEASPNPFSVNTEINFSVNPAGFRTLKIYDAAGNAIRTVSSLNNSSGNYRLTWDGRNDNGIMSAPGVYFVVLETTGAESKAVKTLFLR
jgi:hypothetical protein